ncbi:c2h2 finger domain containing protein [Grosmannia clavigera kw1407]|uniref:C2h2 finger domain containing protein n=1 Tax=Grosmannia clavigera (strain kw1407 / UAMH 11150) TaxID=655863 RepID=F0XQ38_GROCL|nr:c2h2 finger domain containing protein [Grosmannia clavigera kw1407]EFX00459.1 c2h2 finger domain containing protein [Grosmannia clavigera kw1407]
MASSKEMQSTVRPLTHRPSIPSAPNAIGALSPGSSNSLATRQPHSRTGSHSIIGAALNANHRVSRRKSMTSPGATNVAAMAALIQEADALPVPSAGAGGRRNTASKTSAGTISGSPGFFSRAPSAMAAAMAIANGTIGGLPLPSPPASLPSRKFVTADGSAIDDDFNDMSDVEDDSTMRSDLGANIFDMAHIRRASDGQPLVKEGRRSSTRMDLRCDKCGKGYKHSSCLTKHFGAARASISQTVGAALCTFRTVIGGVGTPTIRSSCHHLLIQNVQLLEAASVLVAMNNQHPNADVTVVNTPPESARDYTSERDSASPIASTYFEQNDGHSSVDTTPPPQLEGAMNIDGPKRDPSLPHSSPPASLLAERRHFLQRFGPGNGHGGISQSYQSGLPAGPVAGRTLSTGSVTSDAFAFGHQPHRGSLRPSSSGRNTTGQEDNELAAAVEMLSCSFNSAGGEVHGFVQNMPPVPPVPAMYLGQTAQPLDDTSFISSFPSRAPESFTRGDRFSVSGCDDVMMEESSESLTDEDDDDIRSRARSDDDDDGVFGRMEE